METKKTTLQNIKEQYAEQMRDAIEQAIDEGAEIRDVTRWHVTIDDVFLQRSVNGYFAIVLQLNSEKIEKIFEPSKDDLEKKAEEMRAELKEIEKQINAKKK